MLWDSETPCGARRAGRYRTLPPPGHGVLEAAAYVLVSPVAGGRELECESWRAAVCGVLTSFLPVPQGLCTPLAVPSIRHARRTEAWGCFGSPQLALCPTCPSLIFSHLFSPRQGRELAGAGFYRQKPAW